MNMMNAKETIINVVLKLITNKLTKLIRRKLKNG